MHTLSRSLRRHFAPLCLVCAFLAFASVTRADDVPTFSDPAVTAFAQDYNTFIDQYIVIMKDYMGAMKTNDTAKMQDAQAKMQAFQAKAQELQSRGATLQGKLKPEETKKFTDYVTVCIKRMTDSLQAQAQ